MPSQHERKQTVPCALPLGLDADSSRQPVGRQTLASCGTVGPALEGVAMRDDSVGRKRVGEIRGKQVGTDLGPDLSVEQPV